MQIRCPHCLVSIESGGELSWSEAVCPSCGGRLDLADVDTTCTYSPGVQLLGRFELLQKVGSGRFGSVWKARDTHLQRTIAIKIPRHRDLDPQESEIFLRDARAAAQLKHPGIAGVHEVGRENETVYIVTDYIDGANLSEWLTSKRLTIDEAARLVVKIADALHHAHEKGVVHRDVKPGNIMMDRNGEPHVIDFGLALRDVGEETVTIEGQLLGTPSYMPPEQARGEGHWADRRSDIYSLGVILFRLLTGELPFRGETRMLILQILHEEPPSPRKLNADVPRDLETITLKCLEKEPAKRFQTARELADDLRRYLKGEPIKARPVGRLERGWRWCTRNPAIASLSAALLLTLVAVSTIAPIVALHQAQLRRESELRRIELQNQVANNLFQRACEEYGAGRIGKGIAMLSGAYELAVGPDNPMHASICRLMTGWSAEGGRPFVYDSSILAAALSPDGHTMIIGGHDQNCPARLWNTTTGIPFGDPMQHEGSVRAVAFSPDGQTILTGSQDKTARLWDARTGHPLAKPMRHEHEVWAVAFSPDGTTIATGSKDNTARLWDAKTGESIGVPLHHQKWVLATAFSPDGRTLVTGCLDGTAQQWDVQSKRPSDPPIRVETPVYAVAFSRDGNKILTGSADGAARWWDARTRESVGEPMKHENENYVYALALSPDGQTVLTGSFDNTARLWNAHTGKPIREPLCHGGYVMSVSFGPEGRTVLTGSADRTARIWNIDDNKILTQAGNVQSAAFSPKGDVALTGGDTQARLWHVESGRSLGEPWQLEAAARTVSFSPDGRTALTGTDDRRAQLWDTQTGKSITKPWKLAGVPRRIEFCTDGKSAYILCADNGVDSVQGSNVETGEPLSTPVRFDASDEVIAFSPDDRTVLVRDKLRAARLWDLKDARPLGEPLRHAARVMAAEFSADGRFVVTAGYDQEVRRWSVPTGDPIGSPFRHEGIVNAVAIGKDGTTIVSGSRDQTARLWDSQSGMMRGQPLQHTSEVTQVVLSPDSCLALTICLDGSARIWDVASCKVLTRPMLYELSVTDGIFNSDGSVILFRCADGTARLYEIPRPLNDDPKTIRTWAETRSGFRLDEQGALHQLTQSEWLKAQQESALSPSEPTPGEP